MKGKTWTLAALLLLGGSTLRAQEAVEVNRTDGVTLLTPVATTDSITFSEDGATAFFHLTDTTGTVSVADIDSITFGDTISNVLVTYSAAGVSVLNPYAFRGVDITVGDGNAVVVNATTDAEVNYILAGSGTGSFKVYGTKKQTLTLNGLTLTSPDGPAVNIQNKKKTTVVLAEGTTNTLTDATTYTAYGSEDMKGTLFSEGQLVFEGTGKLNVSGLYKHAIASDDYISVTDGNISVTSAQSDGLHANDYFEQTGGTLTITGTTGDGIDADAGYIDISGGTLDVTVTTADTKGLKCDSTITLSGGTITVTVESAATAGKCVKAGKDINVSGGTIKLYAYGAIDLTDTTDPAYTTALKTDANYTQTGGDVTLNVTGAAGRGVACDSTLTLQDGSLTITNTGATQSGSSYFYTAKGMKGGVVAIDGGTLTISMSGAASKGVQADADDGSGNLTITGGTINVTTSGAGAYDTTEQDAKGCAGLKADNDMTISGGTLTLRSTGTGGKCIRADGTLTVNDGTINATTTGAIYKYSNSITASPKAIKAGEKTQSGYSYTYSGGMVFNGGTINASATNHEAIESKNTIEVNGGYIYAYSGDDAINSASTFTINGGYVMGNSSGNDGLDANGNFYITGGTVFAVATTSPEVGIDANTEGGYQLYITGGTVVAIGGLESGSSISNGTAKQASSYSKGSTYALYNGSNLALAYKVPSNSKMGSGMVVYTSDTPTLYTATGSGTTFWDGYGYTSATNSSSVSLSTYSGGNSGGGGGGGGQPGGGGGGGGGRF